MLKGQKIAIRIEYDNVITERHNREKAFRANDVKYSHPPFLSNNGVAKGDQVAWKQARGRSSLQIRHTKIGKRIEKDPVVLTGMNFMKCLTARHAPGKRLYTRVLIISYLK